MKTLWYVIGILAVLVAVAIVVRGRDRAPATSDVVSPTPTESASPTSTPLPTVTRKPSAKRLNPTPVATPSYSDVAGQYAGNRIQFDEFCAAYPVETVFTDGTQVMLDNRAPDDRVVAIGDVQHGLRAYGWKVVTMTAAILPVTLPIDCGSAHSVGKVTIEPIVTLTPEPSPASSSAPMASASASPSLEPTP